jgi:hypothetical protein
MPRFIHSRCLFLKGMAVVLLWSALWRATDAAITVTPAPHGGLVPNCSFPYIDCQLCFLLELVNNVIRFLIVDVATPIAALSFAVAGIMYLTAAGNTGQIARAHSIFKKVVIGFILILAAWLLIDTVMKYLVQDDNFGPWNEFDCVTQPLPQALPTSVLLPDPQPIVVGGGGGGGGGGTNQCQPGNSACSVNALLALNNKRRKSTVN